MRVAYVTMGDSVLRGGVKLFIELGKRVAKKVGWEVTIFMLGTKAGAHPEREYQELYGRTPDDDGISITHVGSAIIPGGLTEGIKALDLPTVLSKVGINKALVMEVFDTIAIKYDVIHLSPWYAPYVLGLPKRVRRSAVITPLYHPYLFAPGEGPWLEGIIDPLTLGLIKLAVLSPYLRGFSAATCSTPYETNLFAKFINRSIFVGEGVDIDDVRRLSRTNPPPGLIGLMERCELTLLYLGSRAYGKGYYHTVEAVAKSGRACLVVIGPRASGPQPVYEDALRAEGRLLDLGVVDEATKLSVIRAVDAMILPSVYETVPLAFLEGWVFGKPAIGAETPTLTSVITYQGDGGYLVKFGDIGSLTKLINALAKGVLPLREAGMAGMAKVERVFNLDAVAARVMELYEELVSDVTA